MTHKFTKNDDSFWFLNKKRADIALFVRLKQNLKITFAGITPSH